MLSSRRDENGSAPLGAVFAMTFLMVVALAVVEVALALYGRNVAMAAAHEGARAAIELGAGQGDAVAAARNVVVRSTGALISSLGVRAEVLQRADAFVVHVRVTGVMDPPGPLPVPVPIDVTAAALKETRP